MDLSNEILSFMYNMFPISLILLTIITKHFFFKRYSTAMGTYERILGVISGISLLTYFGMNTVYDGCNYPSLIVFGISYFLILNNILVFNMKFRVLYSIVNVREHSVTTILTSRSHYVVGEIYVPLRKCLKGKAKEYVQEETILGMTAYSSFEVCLGRIKYY